MYIMAFIISTQHMRGSLLGTSVASPVFFTFTISITSIISIMAFIMSMALQCL
jgi:hypothetical protein